MQPQARVGDFSGVPSDVHGKPCCAHVCSGPGVSGSPDVFVNGQAALRVTDFGVHALCCDINMWVALTGSNVVKINNLPAHRMFDFDVHCGGMGFMVQGSPDVFVGDCTETGLSVAQQTTQATVEVPQQVSVEAVPVQQLNVDVVPVQPVFVQAFAIDPVTMQPIPSTPAGPGGD